MTVYGLDIAKYQSGLKLTSARDQGFTFCMAKVSEGTYEKDRTFDGFRDQAEHEELHFAAYHFLTEEDPAAQARFCLKSLGDKSIPIMLDVEAEGSSIPQISHVKGFINGIKANGGRVTLCYIPEWYWHDHMGKPSLVGLPRIVQSSYVSGSGYASSLYPGDSSSRWNGFGGITPTILQYSSNAKYTGYNGTIDVNAFRGTEDQLRSLNLFKDYSMATLDDATIQAIADKVIAQFYLDIRRGPDSPTPPGQSGNNKELRRIVREEVAKLLPPTTH